MNEKLVESQPDPIVVGEKLSGLLVSADERPEGVEYWDQVIDSPYGRLFYAPDQRVDGTIRWTTNHGEVLVKVKPGTGEVLEIDTEAQGEHPELYTHLYEMGVEAYQEQLRRRTESDEHQTGIV